MTCNWVSSDLIRGEQIKSGASEKCDFNQIAILSNFSRLPITPSLSSNLFEMFHIFLKIVNYYIGYLCLINVTMLLYKEKDAQAMIVT